MDQHRFDDLTKTLADGATRRSALKTLAGGAAGALAVLLGRPAAAAPPPGKGPSKSECCPPEAPLLCGGLTCVECCADTDCEAGLSCFQGTCQTVATGACPVATTCPAGQPNIQYCDDPNCFCIQTVDGTTACLPPMSVGSGSCTSSADCGAGAICVADPCGSIPGQVCYSQGSCGTGACGAETEVCTPSSDDTQGSCCTGLVCNTAESGLGTCGPCGGAGEACFGESGTQASCCTGLVCDADPTTGAFTCLVL